MAEYEYDPNALGAPETPEKSHHNPSPDPNPQAKDAPSEPAPTNGLLAGEKYHTEEHVEEHEEEEAHDEDDE